MKDINPLMYSFSDEDALDNSSNITYAKYCAYTNTLVLKFSGGGVYLYSALPPSVYRSFYIAESKGRFFARKIRGAYPYKRMPTS